MSACIEGGERSLTTFSLKYIAFGKRTIHRRPSRRSRAPPFLAPAGAGLAANNVVIDTLLSLSLSLAYLLPNLNIASAKNGALITICPWLEFVVLLFRSDPQIWVKDDRSVALLIFYSPETMMTLVSGKNRIFSLLASFFWDFYFMFCLSAGIKPGTPLVVPRNHEIPSHNRVINKIVFAKSNISA